ncbi:MAG: DUF3461 family protein [Pontibacterium sp.]
MSEYSTLNAMGLADIRNISHYKLSQQGQQEVLKVYFNHSEGSVLPKSSNFCFERNKIVAADSEAASQSAHNAGSDPVLLAAIQELNSLSKHRNNNDRRTTLLNELDRLEQVMSAKLRELREDLKHIS